MATKAAVDVTMGLLGTEGVEGICNETGSCS